MLFHQSGAKWNDICPKYFKQEYFQKSELLVIVNI